jgi:hypothetical protein
VGEWWAFRADRGNDLEELSLGHTPIYRRNLLTRVNPTMKPIRMPQTHATNLKANLAVAVMTQISACNVSSTQSSARIRP